MHELLAELFPWIVALYVVDGVAQLGRGHLLLVGSPRRFRLVGAGLHLVGLSPLDEVIAAHDLPFLASARRVFLFDPRRRSEPAVVEGADLEAAPREALAPVSREGRKVRAAGRVVLAAPTAEWAERLRAELAAPAAGEADGDPAAALAAARGARARTRGFLLSLRVAAALLFVATFAAWPLVAYGPLAAALSPGALLAALAALVALVAALAGAMLAACGEGARRSLGAALHLALYPVAALRPLAHAPRSLYRGFDAATIAAALLPAGAFRAWAAREIRRARLSRAATPPELAGAWDARERSLARLLAAVGVGEDEALAPPPREPHAAAWCPLCLGQYRAGADRCADCGVAAEPFGR